MVDELLPLKNSFYTGGYQKLYASATGLPPQQKSQVKSLVLRALLAERNYSSILSQITPSDPAEIQAISLLAKYYQRPSDDLVEEMEALVDRNGHDEGVLVVGASLFATHGLYEKALTILAQLPQNMEAYV